MKIKNTVNYFKQQFAILLVLIDLEETMLDVPDVSKERLKSKFQLGTTVLIAPLIIEMWFMNVLFALMDGHLLKIVKDASESPYLTVLTHHLTTSSVLSAEMVSPGLVKNALSVL